MNPIDEYISTLESKRAARLEEKTRRMTDDWAALILVDEWMVTHGLGGAPIRKMMKKVFAEHLDS